MKKSKEKISLLIEVTDSLQTLVAAGFGLVAALAWNTAIQNIFMIYLPQPKDSLWAQLLYALLITLFVVVTTLLLARYTTKLKDLLKKD
jgi:hypothetical protein